MHLYNLTLRSSSTPSNVTSGHFTCSGCVEYAVVSGSYLHLYSIQNDILSLISTTSTFGQIINILAIKLDHFQRDSLLITSDSGTISLLNYNESVNLFQKVGEYQYSNPGCLRKQYGYEISYSSFSHRIMLSK
ncbi:hypothetical protein WA158_005086 [Blastocystis sp. Blastoise]